MELYDRNIKIKEFKKSDIEEKTVTHYTKFDIFLNNIIKEDKIKLSSFENTNDPKEYRMRVRFGKSNLIEENLENLESLLYDTLFKRIKVFCTTRAKTIKKEGVWWYNNINVTDCSFGNVNMWAHYGKGKINNKDESHAGVAIVFNKKNLRNRIKGKYQFEVAKNVIYQKRAVKKKTSLVFDSGKPQEIVLKYFKENSESLFFNKSWEWNAEREYRIMIFNSNEREIKENIGNSIEAIVLGERVNRNLEKIKEYCKYKEVDLYKIMWDSFHENYYLEIIG